MDEKQDSIQPEGNLAGELMFLASELDSQLNTVFILAFDLGSAPFTEPIVSSLDSSRKIEILRAYADHIANKAWKKSLLKYAEKVEMANRACNTAAHIPLRFDGYEQVLFSYADAKLLESLELAKKRSQQTKLVELVLGMKRTEAAHLAGSALIADMERFAEP